MAAAQEGKFSGVCNIHNRRYNTPRNTGTQLVEINKLHLHSKEAVQPGL
jgi:hypothetical protein